MKKVDTFDKMTLVKSKRFMDCRDVLMVVLSEDKTYTLEEVKKLINKFLYKKVK